MISKNTPGIGKESTMKALSDRSIVWKICMISLICLTIPSLLFSFYLYRKQANESYARIAEEQLRVTEQAARSADAALGSIRQLQLDLAYSDPLYLYLSRLFRVGLTYSKYPIWTEQLLNKAITSIKYSLRSHDLGISAANIYVPTELSAEGNYFLEADRLKELSFFQDFRNSDVFQTLYYLDEDQTAAFRSVCGYASGSAGTEVILILCRIDNTTSGECIGYLLFECSPQKVFSVLSNPPRSQEKDYYVWFRSSQKGYGSFPSADWDALPTQTGTASYMEVDRQQYAACTMEHFAITVVNTHPLPQDAYMFPALRLSLVLAVFALLQFIVLALFLRRTFDQLHRDLNLMDAIIAHGFKERIPETRTDEIGTIAHHYNILLDKISSLISENVQRETSQVQAQLMALQYQMNPHFIYNTLNVFSGYAAQNGQSALAESIASFGQLLRYTIKNDGLYASIEEELHNAASLIKVYNIRYFGRLSLSVDVPEELKQFLIIRFLIQPLLENAILHGLQPDAGLHIHISMQKTEDSVKIVISDDGEGMRPERLREVERHMRGQEQAPPPCAKGTFIGLHNIYKRLKLFYSDRADMSLLSQEHQGTTVTIRIPTDSYPSAGPARSSGLELYQ